MTFRIIALASIAWLGLIVQARAATFYVATNGNDTWSGTLPSPNIGNTDGPFASLTKCQSAMQLSAPGTCYIRAGSYSPASIANCNNGGNTCGLALSTADNGETWSYYPPDGVGSASITGGSTAPSTGLYEIIDFGNVRNLTINGLTFHDFDWNAIASLGNSSAPPTTITITNNTFYNGYATGVFNEGAIQCYGCQFFTITHNVVHDIAGFGITVANSQLSQPPVIGSSNAIVSYNVVYNVCTAVSDCGGIYFYDGGTSTVGTNNQVLNNYVRDVGGLFGIYADDCISNITFTGNIVTGRTTFAAFEVHGGSNVQIKNNIIDLDSTSNFIIQYGTSNGPGCASHTMSGNSAVGNLILGSAGGGGFNVVAQGSPPANAANDRNNAYWNYADGLISSSGTTPGSVPPTLAAQFSDTNPTTENPNFLRSDWTYKLPANSPVYCSTVFFPSQDPNWGKPGFWGPPGFTIPQTGTPPSYF